MSIRLNSLLIFCFCLPFFAVHSAEFKPDYTLAFPMGNDGGNQSTDIAKMLFVKNGCIDPERNYLPYINLESPQLGNYQLIIDDAKWVKLNEQEYNSVQSCFNDMSIKSLISKRSLPIATAVYLKQGHKKRLNARVYCLALHDNTPHKLSSITYHFEKTASNKRSLKRSGSSYPGLSFSAGKWTKFGISETGVQKLSYEDLYTYNVISGPTPSNWIKVWGDDGDMLSYTAGEDMDKHIEEMAIEVIDGGDDELNPGDYILFYVNAGQSYSYDSDAKIILGKEQFYSDSNFVFLTTNSNTPLRITNTPTLTSSPDSTITSFDHFIRHENDWLNFIKSGRTWVGEDFQSINPLELVFDIEADGQIFVDVNACARSFTSVNNTISLLANEDTIGQGDFTLVSTVYHNDYVKFQNFGGSFISDQKEQNIKLYYHRPEPSDLAWLNYIELRYQGPVSYNYEEAKRFFNNSTIESPGNYGFQIDIGESSENSPLRIWAISNYHAVKNIPYATNGNKLNFELNTEQANDFFVFSENDFKKPNFCEKLEPQALDVETPTNFLIIAHPSFIEEAEELAQFHREEDGLAVKVANAQHIYNYLSSGRKEAPAIRNFIKHHYDMVSPSDSLRYVLLFGAGSYDPKNRVQSNLDLIPTFQSVNSIKLTASYVTDDFYAALDDGEGEFNANEKLDVGVGRFSVKTKADAQILVNKAKAYYNPPQSAAAENGETREENSWRNNILFVADDGDFNEHMKQAEILSTMVDTGLQHLNISKTYVDAYLLKETPSGDRFPEAHDNILKKFEEGALIVNYTGHGGEYGWGGERFLTVNGIVKMKNPEKLPLVMTATCEFSRYDDPARVSAGEFLLLQEDGGAIALFTTVRLVFSIPNFNLNKNLYNELISIKDNDEIRIGDLFKNTKNRNNAGTNDRNFTLLGDPALKLQMGRDNITLNRTLIAGLSVDTIGPLNKGTIEGTIPDDNYNGEIEIKIFDKKVHTSALDNVGSGTPFNYFHQENILFKGQASVSQGKFSIDFILPKNTRQDIELGKVSFYTSNGKQSYTGYNKELYIGGKGDTTSLDITGPQIELFLNDTNFTFGDAVTASPTLIAHLSDESGIKVSKEDIGKSIVLTVDQSNEFKHELNNEYLPSVNNYQEGKIYFELEDIRTGSHNLELEASDNYNNSSKAYTEFVIHENAELALEHVLNYPNPFTTKTGFYFEQNQLDANLDLKIQIYTISGKIVKTIQTSYFADKRLVGPIEWDGLDDYGDQIGKGVYLYKISVSAENGTTANHLEKLVILK